MSTRRIQDFVIRGKEIFVGLEDSKKTWKIAVRCEKTVIHEAAMEARYPLLIRYLRHRFPECTIHLIYEAGFKGFNLYDQLVEDGMVEFIRQRLIDGVATVERQTFRKGEKIMIQEGPFKGFGGIFEQELDGRERIAILLEGVDYCARMEIDRELVVKA